jgi:hypothetical protein
MSCRPYSQHPLDGAVRDYPETIDEEVIIKG